ncbi:hypothetical protein BV20DRAFT_1031218 [Pilatotrama ljubarskyi]|nr:hypothetical protein BV20DRAFT_1031218 [Pilatotrama ljubarskyi]
MSSAKPASSGTASGTPQPPPRIPESFIEVPEQRLYVLSLGVACQAAKLLDLFRYWLWPSDAPLHFARKWMLVDFLYCAFLSWLRIPRLRYSAAVVALQIISLWLFDGLAFGGISVNVGVGGSWVQSSRSSALPGTRTSAIWDYLPDFGLPVLYGAKDTHLLGQHTVRMSPISTAQLNPQGETFCLADPSSHVLVPLLLNNTSPSSVRYTLTPLAYSESSKSSGKIEHLELSAKDLRAIEQSRVEHLQLIRAAAAKKEIEEYDEYDDEDEEELTQSTGHGHLQKTQDMTYIRVTKPGTLRLERVVDQSNVDARLIYPDEITIVPCPRAEFTPESIEQTKDVRCATSRLVSGAGEEVQLEIDIYGVPPLSLRWTREVGSRRESFMVEGIEGPEHEHTVHSNGDDRRVSSVLGQRAPTRVKVPLTVVLDALGTHTYTLESVTDALGNVAKAGQPVEAALAVSARKVPPTGHLHDSTRSTRSVSVLRRPGVSFKHCGPGQPASLLIGSEAPLTISTLDADAQDAPWDVTVRYDPPTEEGGKPSKRYKGWEKTLTTQNERKDLTLRANAPGEYTIVGVHGRHCEGDVLSPETCKVVERPLPTAEIEWKKIHECSGDTGVSASLVLHGTPPFTVWYRSQRDNEPPKDVPRNFPSSRGELTAQPDRSGHYTFRFTHMSDANYKKVELKGPVIELDVHPPPAADFLLILVYCPRGPSPMVGNSATCIYGVCKRGGCQT